MPPVISVEHLSKSYRLGQIGTGTFARDLSVWWARVRGKPNPLLRIGETDHGNRVGEEIWALRDVSFTVDQGEVLGVIGRNGAGKSTLLKILSRVTAPTSGQVKVRGRIASLLEVGTGFHPELTGRENIYLNGAILGMTRQEVRRKFDEIVAFAEVEKFIDTPVKRYSSGMYVRLAFAVAAHLESEILLVDEVLAVGDAEFQKKCLGKMGDVATQEGRTVLFVSHNMGSISSLCAQSVLIERGKLIRRGETISIIHNYLGEVADSGHQGIPNPPSASLVRLLGITCSLTNEKVTHVIMSGQDVIFTLEYETNEAIVDNVVCILDFKTTLGQPLFSCSTRISGEYLTLKGPKGKIGCIIPRIPLNKGVYYVDIILKRGLDNREVLDELNQAYRLDVLTGDYFLSGRSASPKSSPVLVDHKWLVFDSKPNGD